MNRDRIKILIIKFISIILCEVLIRYVGDIWKVKAIINDTKNPFIKNLLIDIYERKLNKTGSWIAYNSVIKNKPAFPHGIQGVFVSGDAVIGNNCVIFQQVTIGSNMTHDSSRNGSPVIGDNCYIGAGAKIIGNVKVGINCRIGANCVVVKNIPDNCVSVQSSSRIIQKENLDNRYYSHNSKGELCYMEDGEFKKINKQ